MGFEQIDSNERFMDMKFVGTVVRHRLNCGRKSPSAELHPYCACAKERTPILKNVLAD